MRDFLFTHDFAHELGQPMRLVDPGNMVRAADANGIADKNVKSIEDKFNKINPGFDGLKEAFTALVGGFSLAEGLLSSGVSLRLAHWTAGFSAAAGPAPGPAATATAEAAGLILCTSSMSALVTAPPGPLAATPTRSTPSRCAIRCAAPRWRRPGTALRSTS